MPVSQALKGAVDGLEKQFGKGTIIKMDENNLPEVDTISTTSIALDIALGGGVPRGRVTEIIGPESSGKSTLTLHILAEAQKLGACVLVDTEHSFDPIYAQNLGVKVGDLYVSQPDFAEQALEVVDQMAKSGEVVAIVIDSVAALVPRAEINGDMGDSHMGLQARLMSQALRKLTMTLGRTNTACIFINQLREKIGVTYGSNETTPGGRALRFYASVRMDVRRISHIKDSKEEFIGARTRVKVIKNKVAIPFQQAEFDLMHGEGISKEGSLLDMAVDADIVEKRGAWFVYQGEQLGQGREKVKVYLKEHEDTFNEILQKTREAYE